MKTLFNKKSKYLVLTKEHIDKLNKLIEGFNLIEINVNDFSFLSNIPAMEFEGLGFTCPIKTRFFRFIRDETQIIIDNIKKIKQSDLSKGTIKNSSIDEICFEILNQFILKKTKPLPAIEYKKKITSAIKIIKNISERLEKTYVVNSDINNIIRSFNEPTTALIIHCDDIKNSIKSITPLLNLHKGISILIANDFTDSLKLLKTLNYKPLISKCKSKQIWIKKT